MKSLRNTEVLITGRTSEIGQEVTGRLVVGGAHVAIKCRRREEDAGDTGALIHQALARSVHPVAVR